MNILCIGLGDIGKAVANALAEQHAVVGVSRSQQHDLTPSIYHHRGDVTDEETLSSLLPLQQPDLVTVILAPTRRSGEAGYQRAYVDTAQQICAFANRLHQLPELIFISSTSVYGENEGGWCDESTLAKPRRYNGKLLLDAEQYYRATFGGKLTVIRPSGIYGVDRLRLIKMVKQAEKPVSASHWSNRIFDRDLVNVICQVVALPLHQREPLYIATDTEPALLVDVLDGLATDLDLPTLPRLSDTAVSGKRLRSLHLPEAWLTYPTWRQGYAAVMQHRSNHS